MRESGFDVTFRFGPFGADTHHYAPVCLNSLLYKTEKGFGGDEHNPGPPGGSAALERESPHAPAAHRQISVGCAPRPCFRLRFHYRGRARRMNTLRRFIHYGPASRRRSRHKPSHATSPFSSSGRLGYEPSRVSRRSGITPTAGPPSTSSPSRACAATDITPTPNGLHASFSPRCCEIFSWIAPSEKKYDVVARSQITHIGAGYTQNVIGFGWTNGVFLDLLHTSRPFQDATELRLVDRQCAAYTAASSQQARGKRTKSRLRQADKKPPPASGERNRAALRT